MTHATVNPFFAARMPRPLAETGTTPTRYAKLPKAPRTASPVPRLTSLYHWDDAGAYGDRAYPGNCGGELIRDLIKYLGAKAIFDPMSGSGTCQDVCRNLGVVCWSGDVHHGFDLCCRQSVLNAASPQTIDFDFAWLHPPYWRMKLYADDPRDLSRAPTLDEFLARYQLAIENSALVLRPGGWLAILMGDYTDREAGFVPLVYHTKRLAFELGLRQTGTDIIRFSHGASSSRKAYRSSFIPGLHDVCMIFEKPAR